MRSIRLASGVSGQPPLEGQIHGGTQPMICSGDIGLRRAISSVVPEQGKEGGIALFRHKRLGAQAAPADSVNVVGHRRRSRRAPRCHRRCVKEGGLTSCGVRRHDPRRRSAAHQPVAYRVRHRRSWIPAITNAPASASARINSHHVHLVAGDRGVVSFVAIARAPRLPKLVSTRTRARSPARQFGVAISGAHAL